MKKLSLALVQFRKLLLQPHLAICLALAWFITNGWAYLGLFLARMLDCRWLLNVSAGYLAFLWMPLTPEKIITLLIALLLCRLLFPRDERTSEAISQLRSRFSLRRKAEQ